MTKSLSGGGVLPRSLHLSAAIAVMIAAGALAGCVVEQPRPVERVVVRPAPPPPRAEYQPPPPGERMVWKPGHWNWNGHEYVWLSGRYIERPNPTARWEPGHWVQQQNGAWIWIQGHWG